MPQVSRKLPDQPSTDHGRIAWIVLAVVLICLPLAAIAKMIITNDDELDDVVAQSLIEFTTQNRNVTGPNGGTLNYDALIMKVHGTIMVQSIYMNQVKLGYWNGSGVWDVELDGHSAGHANNGVIWGGNGYPIYLRGLRIEIGYDDIDTANPTFLFLRLGSDDFSGCLDLNPGNYSGTPQTACIDRISMDGKVKSNRSIWLAAPAVTINGNFARITEAPAPLGTSVPTTNMQALYYHCGSYDTGRTDFYISIAANISDNAGGNNNIAWHPGYQFNSTRSIAEHIPGRGFWMHFQALYAEATMW